MDDFLKKVDQVAIVDTSKLNMFLLKEKALEFTKIKSENPKFNQSQICKMLGTSDSTMRRIRNDLGMSSPFRHVVKSKRKKKDRIQERAPLDTVPLPEKPNKSTSLKKNTRRKDVLASGTDLEEEISKKQLNEILGN